MKAARRPTKPQRDVFAEARRKPTGAFYGVEVIPIPKGENAPQAAGNGVLAALRRDGGAATRAEAP